jgi:SWI/SNF-related matrix-associated actin-dependent regulator 1 of chromatin subfamily A
MTITENDQYYLVQFDYDKRKIDLLKSILPKQSYYFDRNKKIWKVLKYRRREFEQWKEAVGFVDEVIEQEPERFSVIPPLPELTMDIPLLMKPYHYQAQGIAYNLEHRNVLIGDQPGLGKTAQAIASVMALNLFPCIIVCPNTLKINWQREFKMWTGKRAMILTDKVKTSWVMYHQAKMADIFIVNYESLEKYFVDRYTNDPGEPVKLKDIVFKNTINLFASLIVDECHKCKNPSTRQAKLVAGIARGKNIQMRLLLSGTSVVNGPKDLWSQLAILGVHTQFAKKQIDFVRRYCEVGPKKKPGNLKELNYHLNRICYYRREKHEVLKDLPPKVRQVLYCELTNRKEYDKAEQEFVQYLMELKKCTPEEVATKLRGGFMVKMGILKHISARGKLNDVQQYVEEILEAGEKVVLFCNLIEMCHSIAAMFPGRSLIINGEVSNEDRQASVDRFQTDPRFDVMICNHKAGGVGLTLTASSRVGMVEEPWTFADCEQCEDRCHRVGQKGLSQGLESIQCTYFLGKDTIDDYIHYDIVMEKKKIADMIQGSTEQTAVSIVDSLLSIFKNRSKKEEAF